MCLTTFIIKKTDKKNYANKNDNKYTKFNISI